MKTIILTLKEEIALTGILWNHKACSCGCILEEMEKSKKDCDECSLTSSVWSMLEKLENL